MEVLEIRKHLFRHKKMKSVDPNMSFGDTVHNESQALQFWKVYFDFAYWLLILPFRLKFNATTGTWELHKNRIQQALVILNGSLVGIYFALQLRTIMLKAHDPSTYFEITYFICDSLYLLVILHLFGWRGREMLEIFNDVQITAYEFSNGTGSYRKKKFMAWVICCLCVSCMVLSLLEALLEANWSVSVAYGSFAATANTVFVDTLALLNYERRAKPAFLTLLCMWSTMYERILNSLSDILFTMTALWFSSMVCSFLKILADPTSPPDKAIQNYGRVKYLVQRVNSATALIIGSFVIGNLPFYVTNVFNMFSNKNIFLRLRYLFYCSYYFPSLFLAAKSSRQMETMNRWVTQVENVRHLPLLDVTLLVNEVSCQPVALDSFGCFYVNFNLVGSIISVILTYALVKSQFQPVTSSEA